MEAVKLALELGGDVNTANDRGYTPLHCAVIRESNELIQFLVDQGARPVREDDGRRPAHAGPRRRKDAAWRLAGQLINATKKDYPEQEQFLRKIMGLPAPASPRTRRSSIASRGGQMTSVGHSTTDI